MITVYEIKSNGFLGVSKEIDPSEGVGPNWTHAAPPAEGPHRWEAGNWIASVEPSSSEPALSVGHVSEDIRAERNERLNKTDWTQGRDISEEVAAMWAPYRQALRDVPNQPGFPFSIEWPVLEI
jgi:hypothetical protein